MILAASFGFCLGSTPVNQILLVAAGKVSGWQFDHDKGDDPDPNQHKKGDDQSAKNIIEHATSEKMYLATTGANQVGLEEYSSNPT